MPFIFISHASQDKPAIKHIVDRLISSGLKIWLDNPAALGFSKSEIDDHFYFLEAGGRYRDRIDAALREADTVLVCWSARAKEDRDVWHSEASVARTLQKLVACRIDDVAPDDLPDHHGDEHIPDLRTDLPDPTPKSSKRIARPHHEVDTQLDLLVAAIRNTIAKSSQLSFQKRVRTRTLRDPFAPFLVDRTDQERLVDQGIEEVMTAGGMRAFFVSGPENECPDEFLERLKRHTSPQRLLGSCWYQLRVDWPTGRTPSDFEMEYQRRLASQLGLPSSAPLADLAAALANRQTTVAIVSVLHAEEWGVGETKRIRAWLAFWHALARQPKRIAAVPILCLKMAEAPPGWKHFPGGRSPGATVSNAQIWRAVHRLGKRSLLQRLLSFLLRSRPIPQISVTPVLHPVRKPDADRWILDRFEPLSEEYSLSRRLADSIFRKRKALRRGVALKDFVQAMDPMFSGKS